MTMHAIRIATLGTALVASAAGLSQTRPAHHNPLPSLEQPATSHLEGRVAEALAAGPYTYLRVREASGDEMWVVTLRKPLRRGDRVTVRNMGTKHAFRSRRLRRVFDTLVFGIVRTQEGES